MLDVNSENLSSNGQEKDVKQEETNSVNEIKEPKGSTPEESKTEAEEKVTVVDTVENEPVVKTESLEEKDASDASAETPEIASEDQKEEIKKEETPSDASEESSEESSESGNSKEELKEEQILASDEPEIPVIDYSKLDMGALVDAIRRLLYDYPIKDVKGQIEEMKLDFQKKFRTFLAGKKEAFLKDGGKEIDFHYSSPVKNNFDEIIREYKKKKQQFYREIERMQKENLELRLALIDELKDLIDTAEASTMYKHFRSLQDRWRSVGQIPHNKYNDVWRTYHHHVERFYDLLHLNNDFRDLDFKHNLEEKTKLIEKAEALAESNDANHAFKELQILHRLWKEDIGPVARESREEVWQRFSAATKKIHEKRAELQERLEEKFVKNMEKKLAVIEQIKSLDVSRIDTHKKWQDMIKKMESLREDYFAIGRVPKSKNEEVWQLFRGATRQFNGAKNAFYKGIKKEQGENLRKKMLLVEQAESLKDSDDWDAATEVFKKIQADWKHIGHVPRKDSDRIWKRFKDACNHYFDRLHEKQHELGKGEIELIEKKKGFLDEMKELADKAEDLSLEALNELSKQWRALGPLPHKMKSLEGKFNKVLESSYKKLNIGKDEVAYLRFKSVVDGYHDQGNERKLDGEKLFVRRKIDEITKEIKQLENNISFISNASEDNPLVKNVYKNIESQRVSLDLWKRKLTYLNRLDY